MTERRQIIFDSVVKLRQERDAAMERAEKAEAELAHLRVDICNLSVARDDEARRAEKAEAELAKQREWARVRKLRKGKKITKYHCALKEYANPDNWSFYHTLAGSIRWVTRLGPDLALEALDSDTEQSSEKKEIENALP